MDERRPLLPSQNEEGADLPPPNLSPRHRDLIPTPCGPIKSWFELPLLVKVYFCSTILSLLVLLAVTGVDMHFQSQGKRPEDDDFTVSLIQLVGIIFCFCYITRGIFQENRQELIMFVLSVMVVIVRSLVNYLVLTTYRPLLKVRFVCILCFGFLHILGALLLVPRPYTMAFRVSGALERMQDRYCRCNLCFSMVIFDLQAQVCLCLLILKCNKLSYHIIIMGVGLAWAFITAAIGAIAVLRRVKRLVWTFLVLNLLELAYFGFLLYTIILQWGLDGSYTLEAAAITGGAISMVIKCILSGVFLRLSGTFDQSLSEREPTPDTVETR